MRNVDVLRPEALALRKRVQTSHSTSIGEFDVDQLVDVVRSVTGRVKTKDIGTKATGASALRLNTSVSLTNLATTLADLLDLYHATDYREYFAFIDNLTPVSDPVRVSALNSAMINRLNSNDFSNAILTPPDIIDNFEVEGFRYRGVKSRDVFSDLNIEDFLTLSRQKGGLDLGALNAYKIILVGADNQDKQKWPFYKCLVFDLVLNDQQYILTEGSWYNVNRDFHTSVDRYYNGHVVALGFPEAIEDEWEESYNARIAEILDLELFDRDLFSLPGSNTRFELCDLLDISGKLIHVKSRSKGSSSLGYLFRQGEWSAEVFLREPAVREEIIRRLGAKQRSLSGLPSSDRPDPREFTVCFAVISLASRQGGFDIPFFSKVSFQHEAQKLETLGFRVEIGFVRRRGRIHRGPPGRRR